MGFHKHIPNTLTSLNLISGSIAIVFTFEQSPHIAALLIIAAAVFDFLDGLSARLLKAYSAIGKQLDSLADLISFGLAPSMIIYHYLLQSAPNPGWTEINPIPFIAFLIPVLSALRLAKFNIDENQTHEFIGLPTPANALFLVSFPLALAFGSSDNLLYQFYLWTTQSFWALTGITLLLSFLMVTHIPLISLKFRGYGFENNRFKYVFLSGCVLLLILTGVFALPLILLYYILVSIVRNAIANPSE